VPLQHGSISRKHAVIILGTPNGSRRTVATIFDLNSSHGTFIKKGSGRSRIKPNTPIDLKEGSCLEFGESSRSYYIRGLEERKQTKGEVGDKRKYREAGYLENDDHIPVTKSNTKRLKPEEHWENVSSFGKDSARKSKFLRLLGAKKKNKGDNMRKE